MSGDPAFRNDQDKSRIRVGLINYRDVIQWTPDHVVRSANRGQHVPETVAAAGLPNHLAGEPCLHEMHGQTDWSMRAFYGTELDWLAYIRWMFMNPLGVFFQT